MNINDAFPSKYFKTTDLAGQPQLMTIGSVGVETVDDDTGEQKPVVHFQEHPKGLVLNRTNANTIADVLGDETDAWLGHQIELFPARTDFKGRQVDCLRVRFPVAGQQQSHQPTQPMASQDQLLQLVELWKSKHPDQTGDVAAFRQWAQSKIGVAASAALAASSWTVEALETATALLSEEEVQF